MEPQKFQSGDKAKVLSSTMRPDFLKHVLKVGSVVEIAGLFTPENNRGYSKRAWGNTEAYVIKGSSEVLLAEELEHIKIKDDFKIKKKNEFDTKELRISNLIKDKFGEGIVLGIEGANDREIMWVGITLDENDIKKIIEFLQKQIK